MLQLQFVNTKISHCLSSQIKADQLYISRYYITTQIYISSSRHRQSDQKNVQVENFIQDRTQLTWRLPEGGESAVDLKLRVTDQFLPQLFEEVRTLAGEGHKILLASHGLFLKELHLYFKEVSKAKESFVVTTAIENTAVSSYDIEVDQYTLKILDVSCNYFACNKHVI